MEEILARLSEADIDAERRSRAFELLLKVVKNILQAEHSTNPNNVKYRWIKCQEGSSFHAKVLSIHPLYGILYGESQEYMVLEDGFNLNDFEANATVLEAVVQSLNEGNQHMQLSSPHNFLDERRSMIDNAPSTASVRRAQEGNPQPTSHQSDSIPANRSRQTHSGEASLEELRRQQQQRYLERQSGNLPTSSASRPATDSQGQRDEAGDDDTHWFWKALGWGTRRGNNDNDERGRGNGGSRPRSSRVMTLRDLPQPKRGG